ncbi:Ku protein [Sandarakinorhabdus sp.]|uniref:Ku protein n=1 Tax=Sandarakinorhabdus sp. TaxID=1916663 RepID=UPI003566FCF7
MAARPYRKGQLRLTLVSIPVEIFSAISSGASIAFNQIHQPSGKRIKLESKKTLELTQFVDSNAIDPIYYEKPYYVVPADDLAEEAFIVPRAALRRRRKVGLGQLATRGEWIMVRLKPRAGEKRENWLLPWRRMRLLRGRTSFETLQAAL